MNKQVKNQLNYLMKLAYHTNNTLMFNELKKLKNELKKQNQNGTI